MTTRAESLNNFKNKTDDLIVSKYLLADTKVSEVLKTIADSKILYELFEYVTDGFDYEMYKRICMPKEGGNFSLPKKREDILAFCFLLLMEIDAKKVDLLSLCEKYFSSPDGKQANYNNFALGVLIPFEAATLKAAENMMERMGNGSAVQSAAYSYVTGVIGRVEASAYPQDADEKKELLFVLGKLADYIAEKNGEGITLAFTALKYMTAQIKSPETNVAEMAEYVSGEIYED